MRKIVAIAKREYVEMIKTKAFLLGVFLVPVVISIAIYLSGRLQKKMTSGPQPTKTVAVTDLSGELAGRLESAFQVYNESSPDRKILLELVPPDESDIESQTARMMRRVQSRELTGYLVVAKDAFDGGRSQYYSRNDNIADEMMFHTVRSLVNGAVTDIRCARHGLSPQVVAEVNAGIPIDTLEAASQTAEEGSGQQAKKGGGFPARIMVPFFFLFLMFAGMIGANQHLLTSVIEEKNSRIVEVILSSVSPMQFMAGKILGLTAVSLTTVCVWAVAAYTAAAYYGMADIVSGASIGYFLIYFVLGFLLISSIFAAVGAACNTLKEAQSFMTPIMLPLVLPMMGWMYFSQNPDGFWSVLLSFVPPLTPMLMILRIAARPDLPLIQIIGSIALLAVSVPVVMWASAKIFRTGILMYGKPATLRELWRWVRG